MRPIPDWGTVPRMLRTTAAARPEAIVCVDGDKRLSHADLRDGASRIARALLAHGVSKGDRVAIWAPNSWQWVVTAFGVWDVGAVLVPLSTRGKGIETRDLLERTGCSVLFVADQFLGTSYLDMLADVAGPTTEALAFAQLPSLRKVVLIGDDPAVPGGTPWTDFLDDARWTPEKVADMHAETVDPDDAFEILCTSGTTGVPKGVVLTGGQILRAYWDWAEVIGLGRGDNYPIVSPFAHGFGINAGLLVCVMRSATMVPIPVFDPDAAFDLIENRKVSILAGPPSLFAQMLQRADIGGRDLSSLRVAVAGAAAVPTELIRDMHSRMGFRQVVNAYGLIEGSVVTMTRADDPIEVIATSAGRPMPGVEVRIVDADETPLPSGKPGEIEVRGYGVMQQYWNAPDLTADAVSPEGWLRTGDIGTLDDAGNLAIVDRKKEMFISNGFNAYPAEIENLLLHNKSLAHVAVVAVPDVDRGEVAWAFAIAAENAEPNEQAIVAWARSSMSNYKVPRRVVFVPEMPTTPNGKIDKARLRQVAHASLEQR
ncbi:AMP-binding protein [Nocardia sp. CA2R105]|uniref:AMP-binding protein n=1 Tax=Nocardia coffeae TaxID=2873381 RepID=UPI001CA712BE|nr:AMP-binding protein [Nocardia coffeae]MBY8856869.1 AMP-binding protein [Nocardia coffeae]